MKLSQTQIDQFTKLEESLWIAETRFDPVYMGNILHTGFVEFGCSGRVYTRETIMQISVDGEIRAKLPFENLEVIALSADVVQITYISEVKYNELQVCNRSSIWVNVANHWQLRFHQGTATTQT